LVELVETNNGVPATAGRKSRWLSLSKPTTASLSPYGIDSFVVTVPGVAGDNCFVQQTTAAFTPGRALAVTGSLAGVGLALGAWSALTPWGLPCPWRLLTGLQCPFCGSTTMVRHLFVGDVAGAWASNQLVFLAGCGLAVACVFWVIELAGGPHVRLPRVLRDQRVLYAVAGVVCLAFMVWRNLV